MVEYRARGWIKLGSAALALTVAGILGFAGLARGGAASDAGPVPEQVATGTAAPSQGPIHPSSSPLFSSPTPAPSSTHTTAPSPAVPEIQPHSSAPAPKEPDHENLGGVRHVCELAELMPAGGYEGWWNVTPETEESKEHEAVMLVDGDTRTVIEAYRHTTLVADDAYPIPEHLEFEPNTVSIVDPVEGVIIEEFETGKSGWPASMLPDEGCEGDAAS